MQIDKSLVTARLDLRLRWHFTQWLFREIYLLDTDEKVGEINFHRPPIGDEYTPVGTVEVGVEIDEKYRGNGFAQESLKAMWLWACEQEDIKTLRYSVSATNHPSMRIIQRFGFTHIGQQQDDVEGPEEIFEMSCEEFKSRYSQS